jgi:hypothetical protein
MVISVESFATWGAFCMLSLLIFSVEGWTPSKFPWGSGLDQILLWHPLILLLPPTATLSSLS